MWRMPEDIDQIHPPVWNRYCTRLGIAPEAYGIETLVGGWKAIIMA